MTEKSEFVIFLGKLLVRAVWGLNLVYGTANVA